jgi:5'-methylthioadenosine/S-adenosylhomocysteine nucleosidase
MRMQNGDVLDDQGKALNAQAGYTPLQTIHYFRALHQETPIPFQETVLFQNEHLVVVDKPHFLPVMPSGKYLQETVLVRLKNKLGLNDLVPIHRIDRDTAGLVLFSSNPDTRDAYHALFRDRAIDKTYEAIAPWNPALVWPQTRGDVHIGDVVVADRFVQHDMDASPLFPRFEIPLYGRSSFPCDADLSERLARACRTSLTVAGATGRMPGLHRGLIVSGDQFVSTAHSASCIQSALQTAGLEPLAVEMEGAAVAQVCHDYGIAFAAVRTISDRSDEASATDFPHFVTHVASRYARAIIDELMPLLPQG